MKKLSSMIQLVEQFAPPELAPFDHVGLLQGDVNQPIKKIGLTLDYSLQAIKLASKLRCDLLITHHGPTKIRYPLQGNMLAKIQAASQLNLSVYRCHLNLDFCKDGIIDTLCDILEIPATKTTLKYEGVEITGGVNLATDYPMSTDEIIKRAKKGLGIDTIRIAGKPRKKSRRIAITSGKGFHPDFFDQLNPDVYIAGEFEQEAIMYAFDLGSMLIELSHHASENRPLQIIAKRLTNILGIEVVHLEIPDTIQIV